MKKYTLFYFLVFIPFALMARGSSLNNHPARSEHVNIEGLIHAVDSSRGLKIGDRIPDITIRHIFNYTQTSAKVSDFKGKLLILDFWATWCSPCVAMIPKMDLLQKEFKDKVQFMPVNNQDRKVVVSFLEKLNKIKPFDLPDVLNDTSLNRLFPHTFLPHFVWISPEGRVLAITSDTAINERNIQSVLSGSAITLKLKKDIPVDGDTNKLFEKDTSLNSAITHKFIPGYQEDLPSEWIISPGDSTGKSIQATNLLMADLFNIALGEGKAYYGRNRIIYDVKDTSALTLDVKGDDAIEWMREGHVFSYEVKTPPGMDQFAYRIMLQDLKKYFSKYDVAIANRPVKCLALVKTSTDDKIHTKGGKSVAQFDGISCHMVNFPLSRLIGQLNTLYMSRSVYPVVDQTGYKGWVDLDINARMSDPVAINKELEKYGLKLELMSVPLDMMVIRDRKMPVN